MAYQAVLERSTDGTNWTTVTTWDSNGGYLVDWVSETPNGTSGSGSAVTFIYRFRITGTVGTDLAGPRRIAVVAGNR